MTCGTIPHGRSLKLRPYARAAGAAVPPGLSAPEGVHRKALRLAIARLRRRSRGHGQLSGERALHITSVALVEDRGRDRPQADFTVLIPTNRMGLRPELVSTH
jgi:hypothetical protein